MGNSNACTDFELVKVKVPLIFSVQRVFRPPGTDVTAFVELQTERSRLAPRASLNQIDSLTLDGTRSETGIEPQGLPGPTSLASHHST
jgi:hypothetical protein